MCPCTYVPAPTPAKRGPNKKNKKPSGNANNIRPRGKKLAYKKPSGGGKIDWGWNGGQRRLQTSGGKSGKATTASTTSSGNNGGDMMTTNHGNSWNSAPSWMNPPPPPSSWQNPPKVIGEYIVPAPESPKMIKICTCMPTYMPTYLPTYFP